MKTKIDVANISGLSEDDIPQRLKNEGFNELPSQKKRNVFYILTGILCEPMLLLLLGSGGIYLFLGDVQDAVMLVTFIFAVIGIT
ncbi:hypothetical protein HY745_10765, partial [Candidatus Desantisbacteria bacterium]|nr:hypothetical protein [Candidatus Desantisbacteria bacterium]